MYYNGCVYIVMDWISIPMSTIRWFIWYISWDLAELILSLTYVSYNKHGFYGHLINHL